MRRRARGPLGRALAPALLFGSALLGLGAAAPPQTEPTFPSGTELVTVDVVVLDREGNPVAGLGRGDFQVFEDGRAQAIATFEPVVLAESPPAPARASRVSTNLQREPRPERTFVVVFDDVHMAPGPARNAVAAVSEFLATGLRDGDRVTVVPASGGAWWSAHMPEGAADLAAVLARLEGLRPRAASSDRISDYEAMRLHLHRDRRVGAEVVRRFYEHRHILEPLGVADRAEAEMTDIGEGHPLIRMRAAEVYLAALARKQATLRAVQRAAESLAEARGRKTVLLVSEGFVHEPNLPGHRAAVDALRRANAALYLLDARGLSGFLPTADASITEPTDLRDLNSVLAEGRREAEGAVSVALDSGGETLSNRNDLAGALRSIARESQAYYLIGYQPSRAVPDGRFHEIRVEVAVAGATVRARKGYWALTPEEADTPDPDRLDPRVRSALYSPFSHDGIPLRLTSYVFGPAGEGKARVLLVAEADPRRLRFEEAQGRFADVLESYVLVSSRETGLRHSDERLIELSLPPEVRARLERSWLPIVREFALPPGAYQARLLLRERQGALGTVRHGFTVPPLSGLRTSTPILTDALQPGPEGAPRPVPLARRTFAPQGRLVCLYEVYGAVGGQGGPPRVRGGYLLRRQGRVLARVKPQPIAPAPDGSLAQMLAISLEGAAPGDYELVLSVEDARGGRSLSVPEPFTVAAGG